MKCQRCGENMELVFQRDNKIYACVHCGTIVVQGRKKIIYNGVPIAKGKTKLLMRRRYGLFGTLILMEDDHAYYVIFPSSQLTDEEIFGCDREYFLALIDTVLEKLHLPPKTFAYYPYIEEERIRIIFVVAEK